MVAESASSALLRVIAPGPHRTAMSSIVSSLDLPADRDRYIAFLWRRVDIVRLSCRACPARRYNRAIVVPAISEIRLVRPRDVRIFVAMESERVFGAGD